MLYEEAEEEEKDQQLGRLVGERELDLRNAEIRNPSFSFSFSFDSELFDEGAIQLSSVFFLNDKLNDSTLFPRATRRKALCMEYVQP